MLSLFGHILRKKDRLRLAYEREWGEWWQANSFQPAGIFPTFEEWLQERKISEQE